MKPLKFHVVVANRLERTSGVIDEGVVAIQEGENFISAWQPGMAVGIPRSAKYLAIGGELSTRRVG